MMMMMKMIIIIINNNNNDNSNWRKTLAGLLSYVFPLSTSLSLPPSNSSYCFVPGVASSVTVGRKPFRLVSCATSHAGISKALSIALDLFLLMLIVKASLTLEVQC